METDVDAAEASNTRKVLLTVTKIIRMHNEDHEHESLGCVPSISLRI